MVIIMAFGVFGCGCIQDTPPDAPVPTEINHSERMNVAVTIPPYREFAEAVGGDRVTVMVMVPPGASPHTYEPTSGQLKALSGTPLYLAVGTGIEFEDAWLTKLTPVNPDMQVVDTSTGISLLRADASGTPVTDATTRCDPHAWLSPANARIIVRNIADAYIAKSPDDTTYFEAQYASYDADLARIDKEIAEIFTNTEEITVLVYHPAWGYYANRYGLSMIAIEADGKEPSPAMLQTIITTAEEKGIPVIFASRESPTRNAEAIAGEIGGHVVYISPLAENYAENLRQVTKAFQTWAV